MHNHSNNKNAHQGMMWMMILCCMMMAAALFFTKSSFSSGGYLWPILIGAFAAVHIWMMLKGHGNTNSDKKSDTNLEKQAGKKYER